MDGRCGCQMDSTAAQAQIAAYGQCDFQLRRHILVRGRWLEPHQELCSGTESEPACQRFAPVSVLGGNSDCVHLFEEQRRPKRQVFPAGSFGQYGIDKHFQTVLPHAVYSLSYYKRFGGSSYDLNNQILNVAVGCKILKRRGDISFTAYDLLNRNSGYKTAMYSDYIQNTWAHSFGRYFTFNIAYKFNKSKSGVTNNALKDGSVKEQ